MEAIQSDRIDADLTVNEVIRLHPATVAVFNHFGVDACCGGERRLEEAAFGDGVDLAELLAALIEVTRRDA